MWKKSGYTFVWRHPWATWRKKSLNLLASMRYKLLSRHCILLQSVWIQSTFCFLKIYLNIGSILTSTARSTNCASGTSSISKTEAKQFPSHPHIASFQTNAVVIACNTLFTAHSHDSRKAQRDHHMEWSKTASHKLQGPWDTRHVQRSPLERWNASLYQMRYFERFHWFGPQVCFNRLFLERQRSMLLRLWVLNKIRGPRSTTDEAIEGSKLHRSWEA